MYVFLLLQTYLASISLSFGARFRELSLRRADDVHGWLNAQLRNLTQIYWPSESPPLIVSLSLSLFSYLFPLVACLLADCKLSLSLYISFRRPVSSFACIFAFDVSIFASILQIAAYFYKSIHLHTVAIKQKKKQTKTQSAQRIIFMQVQWIVYIYIKPLSVTHFTAERSPAGPYLGASKKQYSIYIETRLESTFEFRSAPSPPGHLTEIFIEGEYTDSLTPSTRLRLFQSGPASRMYQREIERERDTATF